MASVTASALPIDTLALNADGSLYDPESLSEDHLVSSTILAKAISRGAITLLNRDFAGRNGSMSFSSTLQVSQS
jgi:hypothetical protein